MRIVHGVVPLFLVMTLGVGVAVAQVPADLRQAIDERQKAIQGADATAWSRLNSDDFSAVSPEGVLQTKAERLALLKQQKPNPAPATRQQEQVKVYGTTAIERVRIGSNWIIQVWARQPQGWQVVATQLTAAAK
jgi:hypothetical protein